MPSGKKTLKITVKDGKVTLDIPGDGKTCQTEMNKIMAKIRNFNPTERINRKTKTKQELVVQNS